MKNKKRILSDLAQIAILGVAGSLGVNSLIELDRIDNKSSQEINSLNPGVSIESYVEPERSTFKTENYDAPIERTYEPLEDMLSKHEGRRNWVYDDSNGNRLYPGNFPKGNRTIGVGFNLERADARKRIESINLDFDEVYSGKVKLNEDQIDYFLEKDIEMAIKDSKSYLGRESFEELPKLAQNVIIDMSFNLGLPKLNKFKELRKALLVKDYSTAADEMVNSKWYKQVGDRSKKLVDYMRSLEDLN